MIQGNALRLPLPNACIHTCVGSPPYWGLRDYGTATWEGGDPECEHVGVDARTVSGGPGKQYSNEGSNRVYSGDCKCGARRIDRQIGLERTPEEFVATMVEVFREVRRVLRDDGTLWLNLGDSYASGEIGRHDQKSGAYLTRPNGDGIQKGIGAARQQTKRPAGMKPKDLCGIPWRVAFALQADGWYLRSDIIWAKPNPMPESVTDRPTKAHEYLFLLSKSPNYYYDPEAIREPTIWADDPRAGQGHIDYNGKRDGSNGEGQRAFVSINPAGRNRRTVWTIATQAFSGAHFATFPSKLVEPCIKAGTSERGCCPACGGPWERVVDVEYDNPGNRATNGPRSDNRKSQEYGNAGYAVRLERRSTTAGWRPTCTCPEHTPVPCLVLDPFAGAGTTGVVAEELGRRFVGIELNREYAKMAKRRIERPHAKIRAERPGEPLPLFDMAGAE